MLVSTIRSKSRSCSPRMGKAIFDRGVAASSLPGPGGHRGLSRTARSPGRTETRSMPVKLIVGSCHDDR